MARGALRRSRATLALAITGVAGPAGGSKAKPVGTVCFAWVHAGRISGETRRFSGGRQSVRRKSVEHALKGALALIERG
jgi:nicotinamide-nucleotide amidase